MNYFTTIILALVSFYVLLLTVVFFFQRNLLYHPSVDNYLKDQITNEPNEIEKVKITTEDNIDLKGWFHNKNLKKLKIYFIGYKAGLLESLPELMKIIINKKISQAALKILKVDEAGLEQLDRDYLNLVINKFSAGPVGLDTLSTALGEERLTLEDMVEPYLLQQGFIMRTPRGRVATDLAFSHLGVVRHNHTKDLYGK